MTVACADGARAALLHPGTSLGRTLERLAAVAPEATARARASLQTLLAPVEASAWPELSRSFSRLTNTGFPVEIAWTSRESSVRYTAEVAPPETPDATRLGMAAAQLGALQLPAQRWLDASLLHWEAVQRAGTLRFGAWIGMRHGGADDAAKVYVELPDGPPHTRRHVILRVPELTWRMVGLSASGAEEYYAHCACLDAELLDRLERSAFGGSGRLRRAATALVGTALLPRYAGVSVTFDRAERVQALTWFTYAKSVFRDDAQARTAIRRVAASTPCATDDRALALYEALTDASPDGRWHHAILGVGLAAEGAAWVQAGCRPA